MDGQLTVSVYCCNGPINFFLCVGAVLYMYIIIQFVVFRTQFLLTGN